MNIRRKKNIKNKSFPKWFRVWFAGLGPATFAQLHLCRCDARRGQELHQAIGGLNRHQSIIETKKVEKNPMKHLEIESIHEHGSSWKHGNDEIYFFGKKSGMNIGNDHWKWQAKVQVRGVNSSVWCRKLGRASCS